MLFTFIAQATQIRLEIYLVQSKLRLRFIYLKSGKELEFFVHMLHTMHIHIHNMYMHIHYTYFIYATFNTRPYVRPEVINVLQWIRLLFLGLKKF